PIKSRKWESTFRSRSEGRPSRKGEKGKRRNGAKRCAACLRAESRQQPVASAVGGLKQNPNGITLVNFPPVPRDRARSGDIPGSELPGRFAGFRAWRRRASRKPRPLAVENRESSSGTSARRRRGAARG